jgi:hypothetical protein
LLPNLSFSRDKDDLDNEKRVSLKAKGPRFWVVNFGTARTLKRRHFGFAAGMGG